LYLGHIDSLGRYRSETLSDENPIQRILAAKENSKKKFSLNLRGLITNPKDLEKAEEEAWKTARMIIADVISTRNQS
jgi:hypothetical protein